MSGILHKVNQNIFLSQKKITEACLTLKTFVWVRRLFSVVKAVFKQVGASDEFPRFAIKLLEYLALEFEIQFFLLPLKFVIPASIFVVYPRDALRRFRAASQGPNWQAAILE